MQVKESIAARVRVRDIIGALGGPAAVGKRLNVRSQAVSLWIARGKVPTERVPQLVRMARSVGVPMRAEQIRPDLDWQALRGRV